MWGALKGAQWTSSRCGQQASALAAECLPPASGAQRVGLGNHARLSSAETSASPEPSWHRAGLPCGPTPSPALQVQGNRLLLRGQKSPAALLSLLSSPGSVFSRQYQPQGLTEGLPGSLEGELVFSPGAGGGPGIIGKFPSVSLGQISETPPSGAWPCLRRLAVWPAQASTTASSEHTQPRTVPSR